VDPFGSLKKGWSRERRRVVRRRSRCTKRRISEKGSERRKRREVKEEY
jgi:hypothetical protein